MPWLASPEAQAAAAAELATLAPTAEMVWNANTGTFSNLWKFDVPLPECTDGKDVNALVRGFITEHPALFPLDLSEWTTLGVDKCEDVTANINILHLSRLKVAGHTMLRDTFAYSVARENNVVTLKSFYATFLPAKLDGLSEKLDQCNVLTEPQAIAAIKQATLQASVLHDCIHQGDASYTPKANDTFEFSSSEAWSWEEGTGNALFSGTKTLKVTVHPDNYTEDLLNSNAKCQGVDANGNPYTIGFTILVDLSTGAIMSVQAGLGCIVC